jgi:hypothetical protein
MLTRVMVHDLPEIQVPPVQIWILLWIMDPLLQWDFGIIHWLLQIVVKLDDLLEMPLCQKKIVAPCLLLKHVQLKSKVRDSLYKDLCTLLGEIGVPIHVSKS